MLGVLRVVLALLGLSLVPLPARIPSSHAHAVTLSAKDRRVGGRASLMAVKSPDRAVRWLRRRSDVQGARLGSDRRTVEIRFRDGAEMAILPRFSAQTSGHVSSVVPLLVRARLAAGAAPGRALILEPFANELSRGPDAGQAEAAVLKAAGFQVDILRNSQVTVPVMEKLADYSVVYMETHSFSYSNGDAVVATGEPYGNTYDDLRADHSVTPVLVAGDPSETPYFAITTAFVQKHVGTFPNSSIVFFNGCNLLGASLLWGALHGQNLTTFITWDGEVPDTVDEAAAQFLFDHLAQGDTVASGIAQAQSSGVGVSGVGQSATRLGFVGDGNDTLARALAGLASTPTPTSTSAATATPTATSTPTPKAKAKHKAKHKSKPKPTPTPTPKPKHKQPAKCKRGYHLVKGKCKAKHPAPKKKRRK